MNEKSSSTKEFILIPAGLMYIASYVLYVLSVPLPDIHVAIFWGIQAIMLLMVCQKSEKLENAPLIALLTESCLALFALSWMCYSHVPFPFVRLIFCFYAIWTIVLVLCFKGSFRQLLSCAILLFLLTWIL